MPVKKTKEELPNFSPELRKLRTYLIPRDIEGDWKKIIEWFENDPTCVADLRDLVKRSADIAVKAENLWHLAKEEEQAFGLEYRKTLQVWRSEAIHHWELEKQHGFHKQITEVMIEDYILETFPIPYLTLQARKGELAHIVSSLKTMSARVVSRGSDLRKLLDAELRRPGTPNWFDQKE